MTLPTIDDRCCCETSTGLSYGPGRRRRSEVRQVHQRPGAPLQWLLRAATRVPHFRTHRVYRVLVVHNAQPHLAAVVVRISVLLQLVPDRLVVLDHAERLQELQHPAKRDEKTDYKTWQHCTTTRLLIEIIMRVPLLSGDYY